MNDGYEEQINKLFQLIRDGDVVLWAGAGFSVSAGLPSGNALNNMLLNEFFSPEDKDNLLGHSQLSQTADRIIYKSDFTKEDNEEHLYQYLRKVFIKDNCDNTVHKRLAKIPYIKDIITTNYDNLFELAYEDNADVIFDNASYSMCNKKVRIYKIHGDIFHNETIILTNWDYENFISKVDRNLLASKMKDFFATKTVLFIGFSFEDINIGALYNQIFEIHNATDRKHYLVSPGMEDYKIAKLKSIGIKYIDADADQILTSLEERTKEYLMRDMEGGKISYNDTIKVTKESGFYPDIESNNGEVIIKGVTPLENSSLKLSGTLHIDTKSKEYSKFMDVIKGNTFETVTLSNGFINNIKMFVEGYTLDEYSDISDVVIEQVPFLDNMVEVFYNDMLFPVMAHLKIYRNASEICYRIKLGDLIIQIVKPMRDKTASEYIEWGYEISGDTIHKLAKSSNELLKFFKSKKTILKYNEMYLTITNPYIYNSQEFQANKNDIELRNTIYEKLYFIEKHFEIMFHIDGDSILDANLVNNTRVLYNYIVDNKVMKIKQIHLYYTITNGADIFLLTRELMNVSDIKFSLLGKEIVISNWNLVEPHKIYKTKKNFKDMNGEELITYKSKKKMIFSADVSII